MKKLTRRGHEISVVGIYSGSGIIKRISIRTGYPPLLFTKRFSNLSDELGTDIEFKRGGYLVLIERESQWEQIKKNVELQNSLGIPSKILDIKEALEIVPYLNPDAILGSVYCPIDGHANPLLTVWAYYHWLSDKGVTIKKFTEVVGIKEKKGKIVGVETSNGEFIAAPVVVNAAGGWSQKVAAMLGIELPLRSERHQILVTEPIAPLFHCMVISFITGLYIQQVPHGSIIAGIGEKDAPEFNMESSWQFLNIMAHQIQNTLPALTTLHIVRQWAGMYNKSPDATPILGPVDGLEGFYLACGFSGHGFMVAPVVGEIIASLITDKEPPFDPTPLYLDRFTKGELIQEPSVVG